MDPLGASNGAPSSSPGLWTSRADALVRTKLGNHLPPLSPHLFRPRNGKALDPLARTRQVPPDRSLGPAFPTRHPMQGLDADPADLSNSVAKPGHRHAMHATIEGLPKQGQAKGPSDRIAKLHSHHLPLHGQSRPGRLKTSALFKTHEFPILKAMPVKNPNGCCAP